MFRGATIRHQTEGITTGFFPSLKGMQIWQCPMESEFPKGIHGPVRAMPLPTHTSARIRGQNWKRWWNDQFALWVESSLPFIWHIGLSMAIIPCNCSGQLLLFVLDISAIRLLNDHATKAVSKRHSYSKKFHEIFARFVSALKELDFPLNYVHTWKTWKTQTCRHSGRNTGLFITLSTTTLLLSDWLENDVGYLWRVLKSTLLIKCAVPWSGPACRTRWNETGAVYQRRGVWA